MYRKIKLFLLLFVFTFAISCGQQKKYVEYTVKKGETMRTIAKHLNLKVRYLLRLNPNVGREPSPNTNIIIPNIAKLKEVKKEEVQVKDTVLSNKNIEENFLKHTIVQGDTFYSLTRFYNVSETTLLRLNPKLFLNELKIGEEILIKPIEKIKKLLYRDTIVKNTNLKIALLLPFKTMFYDTIPSEEIFIKKNKLINIVSDFYLGAAFAIDSIQQQGVSVTLNVYDTGKKKLNILTFFKKTD